MDVQVGQIYRFYKGGYFYVHSIEESLFEKLPVIYMHRINSGGVLSSVFTHPSETFFSPVDVKDLENVFSQPTRFALFNPIRELADVSNERLLEELTRRDKIPNIVVINKNNIIDTCYCVGEYRDYRNQSGQEGDVYFEVAMEGFETFEKARDWLDRHPQSSRHRIYRKLFLKDDACLDI